MLLFVSQPDVSENLSQPAPCCLEFSTAEPMHFLRVPNVFLLTILCKKDASSEQFISQNVLIELFFFFFFWRQKTCLNCQSKCQNIPTLVQVQLVTIHPDGHLQSLFVIDWIVCRKKAHESTVQHKVWTTAFVLVNVIPFKINKNIVLNVFL